MKIWQHESDFVLKNLCDMIINRDLLKIKLKNKPIKDGDLTNHKETLMDKYGISQKEAEYFVFTGSISNQAYEQHKHNILIRYKNGTLKDIVKASDQLNLEALSKPVVKYYMCYPKKKM